MSDPTPHRPGTDVPDGAPVPRRDRALTAVIRVAAGARVKPLDRSSYAGPTGRGYSEAMGRGFELALTLVVMGGIGWLVDRLAGTSPVFTLVFAVAGFGGVATKLKMGYDLEMAAHEEGAIWNRPPSSPGAEGGSGRSLQPSPPGEGQP